MSRHSNLPCKVYVGNLDLTVSKYDLENMFGRYGSVRDIWVARNPPGFAFVEFDDSRDAQDAVRALDGIRLCGRRLRVEMSTGGRRRLEIRRRSRSRSPPRSPTYSRRRSRSRSSSRSRSRSSSRGRR